MAITINDVVKKAYRKLNTIGVGSALPSELLTEGISDINDLIDSLNADRLLPFYVKQEPFTLISGQRVYTIGSGGDFDTTRPIRVLKSTITKDNLDYQMRMIMYDEWMDIWNKTDESQIPRWLYYESSYPLGKIYLNYTPSEANTLNIATENQMGEFTIDDTFSLPPSYRLALIDLLADYMLPRFPSVANGPKIQYQAEISMKRLRDVNAQNLMVEAEIDPFLLNNDRNRELFWDGS